MQLESDKSYIQYFLEDMYGCEGIRKSSFLDCKKELFNQLRDIEHKLIGKTLEWHHNGHDKNGNLEIRGDGTCNGCGAEGKWYKFDAHSIFCNFHRVDHVIRFNEDATQGVVITPVRHPATKVQIPPAVQEASSILATNVIHNLIGKSLDWYGNGQDKSGELEIKGDGSCFVFGYRGKWYCLDTHTIFCRFGDVDYVIKFNEDCIEGNVIAPVQNPASKVLNPALGQLASQMHTSSVISNLIDKPGSWYDPNHVNGNYLVLRGDLTCNGCGY